MQHEAELSSNSGEHAATMGATIATVLANQEEVQSFCLPKELAFTAWCEEFDSERRFRPSTSSGPFDASVMPRFERPAVTFRAKLNHI